MKELLVQKSQERDTLFKQGRLGPEWKALFKEILELERSIAMLQGAPHAVELSLGEIWNGMDSAPRIIANAFHCATVFTTKNGDSALLVLRWYAGIRLTDVSDEIIQGHPLTGKGLTSYRVFVVRNSPWIAEIESIDKIHTEHNPTRWTEVQHFLLAFKDRMLEAIATSIAVIGTFGTADEAMARGMAEIERRPETLNNESSL